MGQSRAVRENIISDVGPGGPGPGKGDPSCILLAWENPTALGYRLEGVQTLPDRLGAPPAPCSWCPLPWVGLQVLSHVCGGGAGLTLLSIL